MTAVVHNARLFFLSLSFLLCAALAAWWQQPIIFLLPFVLLLIQFFSQPQYLFYLLFLSIPWSFEFNLTPQLGTDLPDEPLMWLMSLVILMLYAHQHKNLAVKKIHPIIFILALQFIWLIITVITSSDIVLSAKYMLAKSWYLLAFVAAPIILFRDIKIFRHSVILLLVSMMVLVFLTLIRHAQYAMAFDKINNALTPFFRNHVNYSALLVCMVPIQVAILQLTRSKSIRLLIGCTLLLTICAVYFSYSRGAWLALATGLAAFWLLRKRLLMFSFLFFLLLVVCAIGYLGANNRYLQFSNDKQTISHTDLQQHLVATYTLKDMSNGERVHRWVAGIRMIGENWQTGYGPSTFYQHYKNYTVPSFRTYVSKNEEQSTVHNYFLLMIIEQGIFGLLLFVFLIASLFGYLEKCYHQTNNKFWKVVIAATASILVMVCTVNFLSDLIETDKIGSVFYLCVAVVVMAAREVNGKMMNK